MTYSSLRAFLVKRFAIPKEQLFRKAIRSFTLAEKAVFYFFIFLFALSSLLLLLKVSNSFLVEVPVRGGTWTEGVVSNPRFINPVLAFSEADKNLTTLVYSGLMRVNRDGAIENDLAEKVEISPDGLTYTAHLRPNITFHDGEPITTDDIEFTIMKIEDFALKSPQYGNWNGVTLSKIDPTTISFTLKKPYAPFIENLTIGILPKHIWKNVSDEEFSFSQFNILPIGSGPFKVNTVERNSGGIPDYYELISFENVVGKVPYLDRVIFKFYPSQNDLLNAYDNGDIESMSGFSPEEALALSSPESQVLSAPLPRVFGVFFNQNQSKVLLNKSVRKALDLATPKENIVETILHGYGSPIDGPFPEGLFSWSGTRSTTSPYAERLAAAKKILEDDGWTTSSTGILEKKTKNDTMELSFSISTSDAPELKAVAKELTDAWEKLGAHVEVLVFETGDLNQNVIRPRKFDALLFGEVVGRNADVYPFWHSQERNDPGLNIALYANSKVDKLLETARETTDPQKREDAYKAFDQEIRADVPAVFVYTPSYLYLVPHSIHNISLDKITTAQDRFLGIREWYIETSKVWKLFVK
jgi:peptide/nickel transport system substrate-binding protein